MFNLFGRKTAKDFMEEAKETYGLPENPKIKTPNPVKKEQQEFYRVGCTNEGMTTLTVISDDAYTSITLTMNKSACRQLIRMLESTFDVEQTDEQ